MSYQTSYAISCISNTKPPPLFSDWVLHRTGPQTALPVWQRMTLNSDPSPASTPYSIAQTPVWECWDCYKTWGLQPVFETRTP